MVMSLRDANGQELAYVYARETEVEAAGRRGASPSTSRGCRICLGRGSHSRAERPSRSADQRIRA
jgi:hypothetical protein